MNQTAKQHNVGGFPKSEDFSDDQPLDFSRAKSANNNENLRLDNIPPQAHAEPAAGRESSPAPDSSSFSDSLSLSPRSLNQTSTENSELDAKNNRASPFQASPSIKASLGINLTPPLTFSPPKVGVNVFNSTFAPYFPIGGLSHFNLAPLGGMNPGGTAAMEAGYMEFRSQVLAQQRQQQMTFGTKRRRTSPTSIEPDLSTMVPEPATELSDHSNDSTSITTSRQVNSTSPPVKGGARKRGKAYPEEMKDEAYWERRRKNNEAAKRSRDARRAKEDETAIRAAFLEQEFIKLQVRNASLENELQKLRCMLCSASMKR